MASGFLIALAKKRPRPERPGSASRRGDPDNMADGGDDTDATEDDVPSKPEGDDYDAVTSDALDTLADILGVEDGDREDFDSAMQDLAEACAKRALDEEG